MRRLCCFVLVLAIGLFVSSQARAATTPTAVHFNGTPSVGAIFRFGTAGTHGCTASVIASPHHDLVLTAAHCVSGTAKRWRVAPGYHDGRTPYGVWTVAASYVPPQWKSAQDSQHDYAILRMQARQWHGRIARIQDVTGANRLGVAPAAGTWITDIAYNAGINDKPIKCTVATYYTRRFPSFDCHGYVGGSSGSPWLHRGTVVGVIGGLHQGGCTERTSYSSRFQSDVDQLMQRADHDGIGDVAPVPGGDGC